MHELPRDLVTILRTEARNQRTPPIDYVIAEDGGRMVHTPEPDIAMAELLEEAAAALEAQLVARTGGVKVTEAAPEGQQPVASGVSGVGWTPLTEKNDVMTCSLPADETVVEVMLKDGTVCRAWYSCNIMEAGDWDFVPVAANGEPEDDADSIASEVVAWRHTLQPARPSEQAVTEAMVEAAAKSLRPDLFTPLDADDLRSDDFAWTRREDAKVDALHKARAALKAAMEVGHADH